MTDNLLELRARWQKALALHKDERLTDAVRVVGFTLAAVHLNLGEGPRRGRVWPSAATLVSETGSKDRTVRRALSVLEALGYLQAERKGGGRIDAKSGASNVYRLTLPPEAALPEAATMPPEATLPENDGNLAASSQTTLPPAAPNLGKEDLGKKTKGKSPVKPRPSARSDAFDQMVDIWVEELKDILSVPTKSSPTRIQKCRSRLKDQFAGDLEQWRECCRQIARSPFLTGENKTGWKAVFDWVLEPSNLTKILEGNYDRIGGDPHVSSGPKGPPPSVEEVYGEKAV
jgi:hypothetical protein